MKFPMTPQGFEQLKQELRDCKAERPKISEAIRVARELGDLSENADYDAAKEKQGMVEARIREIEAKLAQSEVIDPTRLSGERVVFGATVTLEDLDSGDEVVYKIVGEDEADAKKGLLSIVSPMARALLTNSVGDEVTVKVPGGTRQFEIADVQFK